MNARSVLNFIQDFFRKKIRNYNVLERSEDLLKSEKLPAAPRHAGTEEKLERVIKEIPEVYGDLSKKPNELLDRLKSVRVESKEDVEVKPESSRELPHDRQAHEMHNFGYAEPKTIPEGKCSLRQALDFILKNQNDPKKWTCQIIADEHNMKFSDIENVTANFQSFQAILPGAGKNKHAEQSLTTTLGVNLANKPKRRPFYEKIRKTDEENELENVAGKTK